MTDKLVVTENSDGSWQWSMGRQGYRNVSGTESSCDHAIKVGSNYIREHAVIEIKRLPSEPKYTPGLWKVEHKLSCPISVYAPGGSQYHIANVFQGEADAHLISAAPEMLEVCRTIAKVQWTTEGQANVIKAAKSAIDKAEGK